MESKIKWQIGFPDIEGEYLVTVTNGDVTTDCWCVLEHYQYWVQHRTDEVVAWCKLSDIEPYKEETREEQKTIPPYMDYDVRTEENMKERKYANLRLDVDQDDKLATEATIDGNKITPPENYLIGKITQVDNGMLVEFVKKKPQYPKTLEMIYIEQEDLMEDCLCEKRKDYYGKVGIVHYILLKLLERCTKAEYEKIIESYEFK